MAFEEEKPTPPIGAGQQFDALYSMVNALVTAVFDELAGPAFKLEFDSNHADFTGNILTVDHGLGRRPGGIVITDSSGQVIFVPATTTTTQIVIDFDSAITGTWHLVAV
jgi:hypothetical protein